MCKDAFCADAKWIKMVQKIFELDNYMYLLKEVSYIHEWERIIKSEDRDVRVWKPIFASVK